MSTSSALTPDDLAFLRRPLHGFFTAAAGPLPPQPRPVWYEATDEGNVQLFTGPDTVKVRHLRKDSRASLVVAAPVGESERWVSVAGPVTIETDGGEELCRRLGAHYWDLQDPAQAAALEEMAQAEWIRLVIHPDKVARYSM